MMMRPLCCALVLLQSMAAAELPAAAQLTPGSSNTTTPPDPSFATPPDLIAQDIDSLIAPLDDREVRELLRQSLCVSSDADPGALSVCPVDETARAQNLATVAAAAGAVVQDEECKDAETDTPQKQRR